MQRNNVDIEIDGQAKERNRVGKLRKNQMKARVFQEDTKSVASILVARVSE